MNTTAVTFESVLEELGLIAKWEARGEAIGEARGEAIGKARGEAIGGERKALEIARSMLEMGIPPETVAAATGLAPGKVEGLYERQ